MRVVFAGTPVVALPALDALIASDHDVVAVVTRPDATAGRGRKVTESPVKQAARATGLEVLTPATPKDPDFQRRMRDLEVDCCAVVAYGALLPQDALDIPAHGWVNLHFSVLPAWRGAAPVQHALIAGDEVTGATTFRIEAGLDTGPVYGVMTQTIRPTDTAGDLLERLSHGGSDLLVATLDGIADGSVAPVPQAADGVSHAPKLSVGDAEIDWSRPASAVDRWVRGCTPAPGAWTTFRGERLKLGPVSVPEDDAGPGDLPLAPGQVEATRRSVVVGTASGAVVLGRVRPRGKKEMDAADWARGVRLQPQEVLGDG